MVKANFKPLGAVLLVLILLLTQQLFGQESVKRKLAKINEELQIHEQDLKSLEIDEQKLAAEIERRTSRIEAIRSERSNVKIRLDRLEKSLLLSAIELKSARQRLIVIKVRIKSRARSIYLSRQNMQSMVGRALQKPGSDMVKLGYFMSKIQASDLNLLNKVNLLKRSTQEKERRLSEMYEIREKLDATLLLEEEKETVLLMDQESALSEISHKRWLVKTARDKLKSEYEKIETILVSLTDGSSTRLFKRAPIQRAIPVGGAGLARYTHWPVTGGVIHKYGQYRVSTFQDVVFHKGVLFDAPSKGPVHALERGIIRFVGIMPKYGLVLLLDHGKREYTLYGKLSETSMTVGKEVPKDRVIGSAGQRSKEEGSFYFEVRRGGKSVNPGEYIKADSEL